MRPRSSGFWTMVRRWSGAGASRPCAGAPASRPNRPCVCSVTPTRRFAAPPRRVYGLPVQRRTPCSAKPLAISVQTSESRGPDGGCGGAPVRSTSRCGAGRGDAGPHADPNLARDRSSLARLSHHPCRSDRCRHSTGRLAYENQRGLELARVVLESLAVERVAPHEMLAQRRPGPLPEAHVPSTSRRRALSGDAGCHEAEGLAPASWRIETYLVPPPKLTLTLRYHSIGAS